MKTAFFNAFKPCWSRRFVKLWLARIFRPSDSSWVRCSLEVSVRAVEAPSECSSSCARFATLPRGVRTWIHPLLDLSTSPVSPVSSPDRIETCIPTVYSYSLLLSFSLDDTFLVYVWLNVVENAVGFLEGLYTSSSLPSLSLKAEGRNVATWPDGNSILNQVIGWTGTSFTIPTTPTRCGTRCSTLSVRRITTETPFVKWAIPMLEFDRGRWFSFGTSVIG